MKKLILAFTLIFIFTGISSGQSLQKGNLIGTHVLTIELKPGVSMEQWQEFYIQKFMPAAEKQFQGWEGHLLKGIRGENENKVGVIYIIKSEKHRDMYYNKDGTMNETGLKAQNKLQPILDEIYKLGAWEMKYTDWLVL